MSYGLELRNAYGEKIAGDGKQVYLKAAGHCRLLSDLSGGVPVVWPEQIHNESFEGWSWYGSQSVAGQTYGRIYPNNSDYRKQWIAAGIQAKSQIGNKGMPIPISANKDDLLFVELNGNGILQASTYSLNLPWHPTGKVMQIHASPAQFGTRLKYKVGSTEQPGSTVGNYGLQIRNAQGAVEFDSRYPQLPIEDFFYLTKQQVLDILDGNLVLTRNLRVSISELYASLPTFWSWKYSGTRFYTLHLRKVSNTQIQIGRAWVNLPDASIHGHSIRDMMIYFAK